MDLPSADEKKKLFDALTYRIVTNEGHIKYETIEIIRNYRMVTPAVVSIPQGRSDLIPTGYDIVDKRVEHWEDFPEPLHPLFPEQAVIYNQVDDSCFINALVGWGKTFTALHTAAKLGQKTLVVVHNTELRDQWIREVEGLYGFKPGIIGSGEFDIDSKIVVGNVQSIVKNLAKIEKSFGTLIMDEGHHCPATTFTSIIDSSHARYRIGLSGTMKRKDGKHILFKDYFGPKIFKPAQNNTMNPSVKLLKANVKLPHAATWADKVTKLLADEEYQNLVASIAAVQVRKGHKVLVIADRVDFLYKVQGMIGERAVTVVGETKDRQVEITKIEDGLADVLCGSRQIFSEGISVNPLSCVILAVPLANAPTLEQIIGRIMRLHPGKLDPVVIDIQFGGPAAKRQNDLRLAFYLEKGWDISTV